MDKQVVLGEGFKLGEALLSSKPFFWGSLIAYTGVVTAGFYGFYRWWKKKFTQS